MNDYKLFKITIYSHFFKVTGYQARVAPILNKFYNSFAQMGMAKDQRGRNVFTAVRHYAIVNHIAREYRFHIGQLKDFYKLLEFHFISPELYDIEVKPIKPGVKCNFKRKPNWILREEQQEGHDFVIDSSEDDLRTRLLSMPTGTGKDQPLTEPILTPNGWKLMGEMKVGQEVITRSGKIAKVSGVYPQGLRDVYRVYFEDGRTTECGAGHLWKIYLGTKEKTVKIAETNEIIRYLGTKTVSDRIYIDLYNSPEGSNVELPIDPYLFGYLLGNGGLTNGSTRVTLPDEWIVNRIRNLLPESLKLVHSNKYDYCITRTTSSGNNILTDLLRELKVFGLYSYQKHIPSIYLEGSKQQRLALLQGLMDSDGTVDENGTLSFCSSSKMLAQGVQYLVRSLGGMAKIAEKLPHYTYNNERKQGRLAYIVNIRHVKPSEFFDLPRKKERTNDENQYSGNLKLRIKAIVPIGKKETQCISIDDNEHLYITRDFITTHNTVTGVAAISTIGDRFLVVVLPKYTDKWLGDICDITDIDKKDIALIEGSGKLGGLIDLAKAGQLKAKAIVISLVTMRNYFKDYEKDPEGVTNDTYGCAPEDLCELLGVGTLLVDEAHEHLHSVYQLLTYTHVEKAIMLSATMLTTEPIVAKVHKFMYPKEIRFDKIKMEQYIGVKAVAYQFRDIANSRIKTQAWGSNMYSHIVYEQSIMKNKPLLSSFLQMIMCYVQDEYIDGYKEGDKLVIYAASIEMCDNILAYLKYKLNGRFDIRRYAEKDPYENVIDSDIRVTTVLSAGTAIDIPNLRVAIMTNCILAPVSNLQVLGRLRKLKDRDVRFIYMFCTQIPKQVECHKIRQELFVDRVHSIKVLQHYKAIEPDVNYVSRHDRKR